MPNGCARPSRERLHLADQAGELPELHHLVYPMGAGPPGAPGCQAAAGSSSAGLDQLSSISFSRTATITASIREWICSFSRMFLTWFFTVFSEMNSALAMSRLLAPLATSFST